MPPSTGDLRQGGHCEGTERQHKHCCRRHPRAAGCKGMVAEQLPTAFDHPRQKKDASEPVAAIPSASSTLAGLLNPLANTSTVPALRYPQSTPLQVWVAICIVGAPRSFAQNAANIYAATNRPSFHVDYFFCLSSGGADTNSKGQRYGASGSSVAAIDRAIRSFAPAAVINASVGFLPNPRCRTEAALSERQGHTRQTNLQRTWETLATLKRCFDAVVQREAVLGHQYGTIVRLRPDMLFFGPLSDALYATPTAILPFGTVGCSPPCANDHVAFLPRFVAPVYFNMADRYVYCRTSMSAAWRAVAYAIPAALEGVAWTEQMVDYTLVRPVSGPACARKLLYQTLRLNPMTRSLDGDAPPAVRQWASEHKAEMWDSCRRCQRFSCEQHFGPCNVDLCHAPRYDL
jgi:hypothetical protein